MKIDFCVAVIAVWIEQISRWESNRYQASFRENNNEEGQLLVDLGNFNLLCPFIMGIQTWLQININRENIGSPKIGKGSIMKLNYLSINQFASMKYFLQFIISSLA